MTTQPFQYRTQQELLKVCVMNSMLSKQGFDKFPQLTSSVSGLVLKVNSSGNAVETSSALSAFTISSSDLTNSTLSNISMSAVE